MKIRIHQLAIAMLLLFSQLIAAQTDAQPRQKFTLSGTISDISNNETLIGVNFYIKELDTGLSTNEYGFYSNVNPNVDHPRWSQATERRIGEDGLFAKKRKTLMYNGYEAQVASLYAGMDLKKNF